MTPEQRAKKLLEPYRKQTHPEEDPGFDAMEKDIAQEIERMTAENERLRPILEAALLYDAWAANGDYPHDEDGCAAHDAIRHAVRSYQQSESNGD